MRDGGQVEPAPPKSAKNTNHAGSIFRCYHGQHIRFAPYEKGPSVWGRYSKVTPICIGGNGSKRPATWRRLGGITVVYISAEKVGLEEFE